MARQKKTFSDWWPNTPATNNSTPTVSGNIVFICLNWFMVFPFILQVQGASIKKGSKERSKPSHVFTWQFLWTDPYDENCFHAISTKMVMGVPPKGWLWPINWWWFNNDRSKLASLMTQGKLKKLKLLSEINFIIFNLCKLHFHNAAKFWIDCKQ